MDELEAFIAIVGTASTIYLIVTTVIVVWGTISGFFPVLVRLGLGLWNRKIVIIARGDDLRNLKNLLCESKLFKSRNILEAAGRGQLEVISRASVILAYWPDSSVDIDEILRQKKEQTPLIVYAPHHGGPIPLDVMQKLEEKKHVVVNNFRGRLMNDVVTSMITTGYA